MTILETDRLRIRQLSAEQDAEFILKLLNEPSFIENIGDRNVRTLDDARLYIINGPLVSYDRYGFGLWAVDLKESNATIGMCGLLKREVLEHVDIGYALLPEYWSRGYAREAVAGVLAHAEQNLKLERVLAVVNPDNEKSIRLLEELGFGYERMVQLSDGAPEIQMLARPQREG